MMVMCTTRKVHGINHLIFMDGEGREGVFLEWQTQNNNNNNKTEMKQIPKTKSLVPQPQ